MMASNVDSRGVLRGACTKCFCYEYNGGEARKRCQCGHVPGQHRNLTSIDGSGPGSMPPRSAEHVAPTGLSPSHQHPLSTEAQSDLQPYTGRLEPSSHTNLGHPAGAVCVESGGADHPGAVGTGMDYDTAQGYYATYPSDYYHELQVWPPPPPDDLETCAAADCNDRVYYDRMLPYDMRAFKFCSPECRDKAILETHKYQLEDDLEELRKRLRAAACEDKSQMAKSSPGSQRNPNQYRQDTDRQCRGSSSVNSSSPSVRQRSSGQNTAIVDFKREAGQVFGLILHTEVFCDVGFLITGVRLCSDAHKIMQGDKPRFLDVIQSVNGKAYTELTGSNIQEAFDKATSCHSSISLQVNRCIALAPPARLISKVKDSDATHIIVLRYIPDKQRGLELNQTSKGDVVVVGETAAVESCGIKSDDHIRVCVLVNHDQTQSLDGEYLTTLSYGKNGSFFRAVKNALQRADKEKKAVVLAIKRV